MKNYCLRICYQQKYKKKQWELHINAQCESSPSLSPSPLFCVVRPFNFNGSTCVANKRVDMSASYTATQCSACLFLLSFIIHIWRTNVSVVHMRCVACMRASSVFFSFFLCFLYKVCKVKKIHNFNVLYMFVVFIGAQIIVLVLLHEALKSYILLRHFTPFSFFLSVSLHVDVTWSRNECRIRSTNVWPFSDG